MIADETPRADVIQPVPIAAWGHNTFAPIALVATLIVFGGWAMISNHSQTTDRPRMPATQDELASGFVTYVDPSDRAGILAAAASLRLPEPERREIARAALANEQKLGWIVFTDSMDPDGDVVAVETAGVSQQIILNKSWVPVALPLGDGSPIIVTALKDGGGGGITVALGTRNGSVAMRVMLPGEKIEVAAR